MVALAALAGYLLIEHERVTMQREAIGRARATMSAVDAELKGHAETMQALASMRTLSEGALPSFRADAERVLKSQPQWIDVRLYSAEGQPLLHAGPPARGGLETGTLNRMMSLDKAAVGVVERIESAGRAAVRVYVPVTLDAGRRYVLSVALKTDLFQELLREQRLPADWVIALVDRDRRFVARVPAVPPGSLASESFRAAIASAPEGWFRGVTLEGFQTYTPYVTSALSGWVLGIAIPQRVVEAGSRRAIAIMVFGAGAAVAIALYLAWFFGRRISRPIASLAAAAASGKAAPLLGQPPLIAEIEELRKALAERESLVLREREALEAAALQARLLNEQKERSAQELSAINRELRHRNEENELFVYSVSHDLRSPLVNLKGFSSELTRASDEIARLLAQGASAEARERIRRILDEDIREAVQFISTAVSRLSTIIDALLSLSRIGRVEYRPQAVDVQATVGRVVDSLRATIRERGISVSVGRLPACWGDPSAIEQAFANLLDNAMKYLKPSPGGRVEVGSQPADGEAFSTYFVRDDGQGIAADDQAKIFLPFQRAHTGMVEGEGIGLAIVRRIVERHGGRVWVESQPGRGSTFYLALPSGPASAAAKAAAATEEEIA